MEADSYKTLKSPSGEVLFKDRNSKFFGFAFPVQSTQDVTARLAELKKSHHQARHWCYAYQLGQRYTEYRVNDDGEPANSAGQPIYGQLQAYNLTNTLVVVVRYFGGTKLGVGGLINAYRTAAQLALEASAIIEQTINVEFSVGFNYDQMNKVMRVIKENDLKVIKQESHASCTMFLSVREGKADQIKSIFEGLYPAKLYWPKEN